MAKKSIDKYEAILDAAAKIIGEVGYHKAQISKIAREANVAEGTIYLYFKNKQDLLLSLFQKRYGEFISNLKFEVANAKTPMDKLKKLITMHLENSERDRNFAQVTQIELRQADRDLRQKLSELLKDYFDIIESIIEEGKEQGIFRKDISTKVMRRMIFGTLDETVSSWLLSSRRYSLSRLSNDIFELFCYGLVKPE
ncbi:TetR family transcriptional regulator [Carboxydothermus islandicus]|uniref:TetR family transcriptional regulator n=1 Tax=Carboxydothermus islandicus TaxID=661089 RepID=A0A1L8CZJ5_9THEO|nr:TetR/AcrR family transcriptional regulator [Carboxydothermus islandicus]GAV24340.1 TetR family transcriptional regulator [Carboxydothermus islandicus]